MRFDVHLFGKTDLDYLLFKTGEHKYEGIMRGTSHKPAQFVQISSLVTYNTDIQKIEFSPLFFRGDYKTFAKILRRDHKRQAQPYFVNYDEEKKLDNQLMHINDNKLKSLLNNERLSSIELILELAELHLNLESIETGKKSKKITNAKKKLFPNHFNPSIFDNQLVSITKKFENGHFEPLSTASKTKFYNSTK